MRFKYFATLIIMIMIGFIFNYFFTFIDLKMMGVAEPSFWQVFHFMGR